MKLIINIMSKYDDFTGLYPVSKTIRFEIKPQGRTMEHFEESGFLEDDRIRAKHYPIVKEMIDDCHKKFIDECLSKSDIDWTELYDALDKRKKSSELQYARELSSVQDRYRKDICNLFKREDGYKDMFSEKILSKVKNDVAESDDEEKKEALGTFEKFSGYFIPLNENRKNIYAESGEGGSVSKRAVIDNFSTFYDNCVKYEEIKTLCPEVIEDAKKQLGSDFDETLFTASGYNRVLTQKGIDLYNYLLGGSSKTEGEIKVQGINELLNLYFANTLSEDGKKKRIKLKKLDKQILSDRDTYSYVPRMFENDEEVRESLQSYFAGIMNRNSESGAVLESAVRLLRDINRFDVKKIYVSGKEKEKFSTILFSRWDTLRGMMRSWKAYDSGDPELLKRGKQVDKWLSSKYFSLEEVEKAVSYAGSEKVLDKVGQIAEDIRDRIYEGYNSLKAVKTEKIRGSEETIQIIKEALDPVMDLIHTMKVFVVDGDYDKDFDFYDEFDDVYSVLFGIVPLYNSIRNYCTQADYDTSKIMLNFGNPALATGWDLNKEKDYTSVIFRKDGKYYLGIMNPRRKTDFREIDNADGGDFYEKMEYKQIPDPTKNLPRIAFSAKWKNVINPSEYIVTGYREKKHTKENFDLDFCHDLIDFFKEFISKNEDWNVFGFEFKDTDEYADIREFYGDVDRQAYKMSFRPVSSEKIDALVDSGDLFLFQIYNKDFSDCSRGKPNIHTIYWRALFSDENLKSPVIKLGGNAYLAYRDKSPLVKNTVHRKGSTLVSRTDRNGKPIPEKIYYELFRYKNGIIDGLSDEAKEYEDLISSRTAQYDIVKDRRYTVDKMFFHVPLVLNRSAKNDGSINRMVIDRLIDSDSVRIIGIDRGERNLIYCAMINSDGEILCQDSMNIVGGVDYHAKLDDREKANLEARRSWKKIGGIKQFKEGYISNITSVLAR
jgi:CRISPR-associated protein Cpf1